MTKHRLVIVGAGFGGLALAKALATETRFEVTLVDQQEYQVYTPWLYEIVAGGLNKSPAYLKKLTSSARIPLRSLCRNLHLKFRHGTVSSLSRASKELSFTDGLTLPYDTLVIACGVQADDLGIRGVQEHAIMIKSLADAARAQAAIRSAMHGAASGQSQTILVCGAGPNGLECAAEIAHSASISGVTGLRVVILESADRPLKNAHKNLSEQAERRLQALGIEVRHHARLISCESGVAIVQVNKQEQHLAFAVCLFTAGTRPLEVVRQFGLPLSPRGRIMTDNTFRVQGEEHIYALGDCAAMITVTNNLLPQTAQAAHRQAAFLGSQLINLIRGRAMRAYQPPRHWPFAVALGGKYAVADLGGWRLKGYLGFLLRRLADVRYYYTILPWRAATWHLARSLRLYGHND